MISYLIIGVVGFVGGLALAYKIDICVQVNKLVTKIKNVIGAIKG